MLDKIYIVGKNFAIEDIEKMSLSQFNYYHKKIIEEERLKRLEAKLDLAECINAAYVGSQFGKNNSYQYKQWRENLMKEIDPKYMQRKADAFWDSFRKKSRIFK